MLIIGPVFTSFPGSGKGGGAKRAKPGLLLNPNGELACSLPLSLSLSLSLFGELEWNGSLDGACKRSLTDGPTDGGGE